MNDGVEINKCGECSPEATCKDNKCICNPGFTGDGFNCTGKSHQFYKVRKVLEGKNNFINDSHFISFTIALLYDLYSITLIFRHAVMVFSRLTTNPSCFHTDIPIFIPLYIVKPFLFPRYSRKLIPIPPIPSHSC